MSKKGKDFSYEEYDELLDATINRLEEESANAPKEKPESILAADLPIDATDVVVKSSSVELGEDDVSSILNNEREIIGKPSKSLVVITDVETGKELVCYGNAAEAARCEDINPTTVRTRCAGEKIDRQNRQWKYEDYEES